MVRWLGLAVLVAAVMASALAVIESKNESRSLYARLQTLRVDHDHLETEWGQLQLEQSAWSDRGRVARLARTRLNMHEPKQYDVVVSSR